MPHEQANVLPLGRIEVLAVDAREIVVKVDKVASISLKRLALADLGIVDFDRLGDQLLVG
jgi:hypothetical protein